MSNITTDFVTATKKIATEVRGVLTALHLIRDDVRVIRDQVVNEANKQSADQQTNQAEAQQADGIASRSEILNVHKANSKKENSTKKTTAYFEGLKTNLFKALRKPKFFIEIAALIGLTFYTCETHRTNNLTQQALNLQSSLSRAFVQITATALSKSTIEDVENDGVIIIELQNTGKSITSNVHGPFVVEFPLAQQEPILDLGKNPTNIFSPPIETLHLNLSGWYSWPSTALFQRFLPYIFEDLKLGNRYVVVFGRLEYEDPFGKWWTQFCIWRHFVPREEPPRLMSFNAKTCVDYNIAGGNPIKK